MKPPLRLLDDPSLSAQLRADLELAVRTPTAYDVAGGVARLQAALEAAQVAGVAPGDQAGTATSGLASAEHVGVLGKAKLSLWVVKAGLAALAGVTVVSAVVLGSLYLRPSSRPPVRPPAPAQAAHEALELPAWEAHDPGAARPASTHEESLSQRLPPTESASRREIAQLVRVKELLERDPAAAYRLAQASQREFPHGALRQERAGLGLVALWRFGSRERASRETNQFLARYPQSPLRERLERLLGELEP